MVRRNEVYSSTNERSIRTKVVAGIGALGVGIAGVAGCGPDSSIGFSKGSSIEYGKLCKDNENLAAISYRIDEYLPENPSEEAAFIELAEEELRYNVTDVQLGASYTEEGRRPIRLTQEQREQFLDSIDLMMENYDDEAMAREMEIVEASPSGRFIFLGYLGILTDDGRLEYDEQTETVKGKACAAFTDDVNHEHISYPN